MAEPNRLIIAMTGATGAIYGLRLLQVLQNIEQWETHLIVSAAGALNIQHELAMKRKEMYTLADIVHDVNDVSASIASGAFKTNGMIIAPCSMKTLSSVANAFSDNLIARAADVTLKERRRLLLTPRETPLNLAHLRNMVRVTEMGGIIFPPLPAFYGESKTLADLIDESIGRILGFFEIEPGNLYKPWTGLK